MVEQDKERTKNKQDMSQNLCQRDDIIITKAEERGAAVITDVHNYIRVAKTKLQCLAHTEVEYVQY